MAKAIVHRSQILQVVKDHDALVGLCVDQVNELLLDPKAKFPIHIPEDVMGSYGPIQAEVLALIRQANWVVFYNTEHRSFLIS